MTSPARLDDALTALGFAMALLVPAASVVATGARPAVDPTEKRSAAEWPTGSTPGVWLAQAADWFRDRISLRPVAIRTHHRLRLAGGASRVGKVLIGEAGELFYADAGSLESLTGLPERPAELVAVWADRAAARQRWVEARTGGRYLFLLAPDKHGVVSDRVPAAWRDARGGRLADRILAAMRARGVRVVDPRAALRRARAAGVPTYYRTDSHWTDQGAAVAATELFEELGWPDPGLARAPRARRRVPEGLDLASLLALPDLLPEGDVVELVPGPTPADARTVAVMGDSFASWLERALRAAGLRVEAAPTRANLDQLPPRLDLLVEEFVERSFCREEVPLPPPPLPRP